MWLLVWLLLWWGGLCLWPAWSLVWFFFFSVDPIGWATLFWVPCMWALALFGWWGAMGPLAGESKVFRGFPLWRYLRRRWWPTVYSVAHPILAAPSLDRNRRTPAVIVVHPHGQFAIRMLMACVLGANDAGTFLPTQSVPLVVAHPWVFVCPLLRHFASWLGCIRADPALIRRYADGRPHPYSGRDTFGGESPGMDDSAYGAARDIIITPGSMSEDLLDMSPTGPSIKARRGWIKAVRGTHAWIVPLHVVAVDRQPYDYLLTHGPRWRHLNAFTYRHLKVPLPCLPWGWRWAPFWPAPTRFAVRLHAEPLQALPGTSEEDIYNKVYRDFYERECGATVIHAEPHPRGAAHVS